MFIERHIEKHGITQASFWEVRSLNLPFLSGSFAPIAVG